MIEPRVAFDSILTSKSQVLLFYYYFYTKSVKFNILCDENCWFFQILTALGLGFLGCTEIYTLSLSLTGLLLSASNVLSSFPQAPRSGRGALRRGPERGLFYENALFFDNVPASIQLCSYTYTLCEYC